MAAARRSDSLPIPLLFATDAMGVVLSLGPAVVAWGLPLIILRALVREGASAGWVGALGVVSPLVACAALIFCILILRLLTPALRPGIYELGPNRGMIAWYCVMALGRAARIAGLWRLIHSNHLSRFLYYRALGARIAYGARTSADAVLLDLPLITVGRGAELAAGVLITCHTFVGDRLALRPVSVGEGARVGNRTQLGPSSRLGAGCWVGSDNFIAADRIDDGARIEDGAWRHGNPAKAR